MNDVTPPVRYSHFVEAPDLLEIKTGTSGELVVVTHMSEAIDKFCTSINKNFAGTADQLERIADSMIKEAEKLQHKAQQLRDAAPDLSTQVHDWVSFEREAHGLQTYWSSLFK